MKRALMVGITVLGLSMAGLAEAQQQQQGQGQARPQGVGAYFVDADGNGICDNFENGRQDMGRAMRGMRGGRGMGLARGQGMGPGRGLGMGPGWTFGQPLVAITAEVTGQPPAAVVNALREGRTFAEIAEAAGKSAEELKQAVTATRRESLDQAVAAGRLTQEEADAMMTLMASRLEQRLTSGWAAGLGRRPGFRGFAPQAVPKR